MSKSFKTVQKAGMMLTACIVLTVLATSETDARKSASPIATINNGAFIVMCQDSTRDGGGGGGGGLGHWAYYGDFGSYVWCSTYTQVIVFWPPPPHYEVRWVQIQKYVVYGQYICDPGGSECTAGTSQQRYVGGGGC